MIIKNTNTIECRRSLRLRKYLKINKKCGDYIPWFASCTVVRPGHISYADSSLLPHRWGLSQISFIWHLHLERTYWDDVYFFPLGMEGRSFLLLSSLLWCWAYTQMPPILEWVAFRVISGSLVHGFLLFFSRHYLSGVICSRYCHIYLGPTWHMSFFIRTQPSYPNMDYWDH